MLFRSEVQTQTCVSFWENYNSRLQRAICAWGPFTTSHLFGVQLTVKTHHIELKREIWIGPNTYREDSYPTAGWAILRPKIYWEKLPAPGTLMRTNPKLFRPVRGGYREIYFYASFCTEIIFWPTLRSCPKVNFPRYPRPYSAAETSKTSTLGAWRLSQNFYFDRYLRRNHLASLVVVVSEGQFLRYPRPVLCRRKFQNFFDRRVAAIAKLLFSSFLAQESLGSGIFHVLAPLICAWS